MKKILAILLSLVMTLSLTTGCSQGDTTASDPNTGSTSAATGNADEQKPVTIKWMHHFAEEARIEWVQRVIDKTHELYPYITVETEVQPYDKYVATLKTKIQSDDAPDLFNLQSRTLLEEFVAAGYCADLSNETFIPTIMDAALDAGRFDDKIFSVVQDVGGSVVFYNKKVFADNNLTIPTTYSQWLSTLETLSKTEVAPIAAGYQEVWALLVDTWCDFVPYLFDDNDNWAIDKQNGTSKFVDDAAFADIMTKIYARTKYTQTDPFGTDWNKACELVATGKAAMVVGGFFAPDAILSKNPDVELGAFALPVSEDAKESRIPFGQPGGFIAYEGSANKDATMKLLGVMLSKEMAADYQTIAKTISVVKDVEGDILPALQDIVDIESDGRTVSTSSKSYTFAGEYQKAYVTQLVKFLMAAEPDVAGLAKSLDEEFAKVVR